MKRSLRSLRQALVPWVLAVGCVLSVTAQNSGEPAQGKDRPDGPPGESGFDFGGPPPFAGPGGFGRPGGPPGGVQEEVKLVPKFDTNGDHVLNATERKAAREYLEKERGNGRNRRGPGGPPGRFGGERDSTPAAPGRKIAPADVKAFPGESLYDTQVLRTFFFEFENADWEKEMTAFKGSDVDIPAKLIVDGKTYADVGVHFRGMSSFMAVEEGRKRSLNVTLDFVHADQKLLGYRSLELLNSHEDPSFLRSVLSLEVARDYLPAPKANFVRVVINGENWGVYVNAQPFNKDFLRDWYGTTKGVRWKVPGSPGGQGSLRYLGDDPAAYRRIYQVKSKDEPKAWTDLIRLCKVLDETPAAKLPAALAPVLDVDEVLKFLALENVLVNNDGYWVRASDYSLYEDAKGKFHVYPRDSNETFMTMQGPGGPGGPGRFGGPGGAGRFGPRSGGGPGGPGGAGGGRERLGGAGAGGGGAGGGAGGFPPGPGGPDGFRGAPGGLGRGGQGGDLDPLVCADDASRPLISKLLAVPEFRTRYLALVREIAEKWLDWNRLGPLARQYHALIAEDVTADTKKLDSDEAFEKSLDGELPRRAGPGGASVSLKAFADQRRAYLLKESPKAKAPAQ